MWFILSMSRKKLPVSPFMIEVESDEVNSLSGCTHWRSEGMDKRITNMRSFLKCPFIKTVKAMVFVWLTPKLIWKALISVYKEYYFPKSEEHQLFNIKRKSLFLWFFTTAILKFKFIGSVSLQLFITNGDRICGSCKTASELPWVHVQRIHQNTR